LESVPLLETNGAWVFGGKMKESGLSLKFIFMLTRDDRTVEDAQIHLETAISLGLRHIGFKDVGLPVDVLRTLNKRIRETGATSYLEVVSLDRDSEIKSARTAVDLGVDVLLGGTRVDDVLPVLEGSALKYYPFPGRITGHPSVLEGTFGDIVASARKLAAHHGVAGLDLLAYRSSLPDVPGLIKAVTNVAGKPVIVAGSIANKTRIEALHRAGASGFTIGTAALDGTYPAPARDLKAQLSKIVQDVADLTGEGSVAERAR